MKKVLFVTILVAMALTLAWADDTTKKPCPQTGAAAATDCSQTAQGKECAKAKEGGCSAKHGQEMAKGKCAEGCTCAKCKEMAAAGPINTKCPVTGKPVDAKVTLKHGCCTIAFCCPDCLAKFQAEPAKYMKALCDEACAKDGKKCAHGAACKEMAKGKCAEGCSCAKCKGTAAAAPAPEVKKDAKDCAATCKDAATCAAKKDKPE